ncbi:MAG: serine/threonine protein kinase [Deltaproteobacteria bacterium]|nr:MAG: serine/threonine protein kinase [Deltaproteobacteria bacterium]
MELSSRNYQIDYVLGEGGFGTVYAARMVGAGGFSKQVALKVLKPEVASSIDVIQRLRDEARMLGLLKHRAIVQVEGLVKLQDQWAVVMELVEGVSLAELLPTTTVPLSCALEIGEEVAAALEVAYARPCHTGQVLSLLHRDIKPSNVQITATGDVKLLDFGVAKAHFAGRESETRSLLLGSLAYLAPERLDAHDTHRGDVYALGATLFEILTGEPFGRTSANPQKHQARLHDRITWLPQAVQDQAVVDVLAACLAFEPADRPDAGSLARRLRSLRRRHGEPWLRDWAEEVVPGIVAARPTITDGWSGSRLSEDSGTGSGSPKTLDLEGFSLSTEPTPDPRPSEEPSIGAPPLPPAPGQTPLPSEIPTLDFAEAAPHRAPPKEPQPSGFPDSALREDSRGSAPATVSSTAPRDPPPAPRSKASSIGPRTCLLGAIVGLLLLGVGAVTIVAVPAAIYSMLSSSGIMTAAWINSVEESMDEAAQDVMTCMPGPERDRTLALIELAKEPHVAVEFHLFSLAFFNATLVDAASDGTITPDELRLIEQRFEMLTGHRPDQVPRVAQ